MTAFKTEAEFVYEAIGLQQAGDHRQIEDIVAGLIAEHIDLRVLERMRAIGGKFSTDDVIKMMRTVEDEFADEHDLPRHKCNGRCHQMR